MSPSSASASASASMSASVRTLSARTSSSTTAWSSRHHLARFLRSTSRSIHSSSSSSASSSSASSSSSAFSCSHRSSFPFLSSASTFTSTSYRSFATAPATASSAATPAPATRKPAPAAAAAAASPSSSSSSRSTKPAPSSVPASAVLPGSIASPSSITSRLFSVDEAIRLVSASNPRLINRTVTLNINLNLDPRKPNQSVRGVAALPHGTGQAVRVAVFAKGDKASEARKAGADLVGDTDLAEMILSGKIEFDRCIATPDCMGIVGKVARILGPRGLMPNPKVGTVTADVVTAIRSAKQGQVEFKTDKTGIVSAPVGKLSFSLSALVANVEALIGQVLNAKPSGAKGTYVKSAFVSASNCISAELDIKRPPFKTITNRPIPPQAGAATAKTATPATAAAAPAKQASATA